MQPNSIKKILTRFIVTAFALAVLPAGIPAAETDSASAIPDALTKRKLKQHDASLAITPAAVQYQFRQNRKFTLVDVRGRRAFERLHIPGAINVPLYAVKTKTYLKSAPVVLVNEGFGYAELEGECRRLAERGFKVSILDGGLPAWKRSGGQLVGDLFALDDMKIASPRALFREKDYQNTLVIDISKQRADASGKLIPYAAHMPILDDADGSRPALRQLISKYKNKAFFSILIFNTSGTQYAKAEKYLNRMGLDTFYLQGGVAGYQKYLEGLLLAWKPRDSRMKTVGNCMPCKLAIEKE